MHKYSVIVCISFCLWLVSSTWGCQGKLNPPEKPKVVSKKIPTETPQVAVAVSVPVQNATPATEKPAVKGEAEIQSVGPQSKSADIVNNEDRKKAAEMLASISPNSQIAAGAVGYDPKGKINPFMPLFSSEQAPAEITVAKKSAKVRRAPRTPLEKIDLSQLKLVATIRAPSGNRALVEDGSGKGYIIKKGTYVGMNSGSVMEITNDRVVVEEEVETALGETNIQKRELKLQKAPGE